MITQPEDGLKAWNADIEAFGRPNTSWMNATFDNGKIVWFCPTAEKYERRNNETMQSVTYDTSEELNEAIRIAANPPSEDPQLISTVYENGEANILVRYPAIVKMARIFAQYFDDAGGINFVEFTLTDHPDEGKPRIFVITVQLASGKTPFELMQEAKKALAELQVNYDKLDEIALSSQSGQINGMQLHTAMSQELGLELDYDRSTDDYRNEVKKLKAEIEQLKNKKADRL